VQNVHANLPLVVRCFWLLPLLIPRLTCPQSGHNDRFTFMISSLTTPMRHRATNFGESPFYEVG
jgi:hypothetical protein